MFTNIINYFFSWEHRHFPREAEFPGPQETHKPDLPCTPNKKEGKQMSGRMRSIQNPVIFFMKLFRIIKSLTERGRPRPHKPVNLFFLDTSSSLTLVF